MTKTRLAIVGAFVIGGVLLFAVGLFLIGNRRMLFSDNFEVYAEFAGISGLQNGAKVRVAGMDAGEVEEIHVPLGPSGRFRVKMRVEENLHPLLRLDSVASIQTDGLVGNKFVQIEAGTDRSQVVPDKGTVQSREPFDLADLLVLDKNPLDDLRRIGDKKTIRAVFRDGRLVARQPADSYPRTILARDCLTVGQ